MNEENFEKVEYIDPVQKKDEISEKFDRALNPDGEIAELFKMQDRINSLIVGGKAIMIEEVDKNGDPQKNIVKDVQTGEVLFVENVAVTRRIHEENDKLLPPLENKLN